MNDATLPETGRLAIVGYEEDESIGRDRGAVDRGFFSRRKVVREVVDVQKLENEVKSFLGALEKIIGNVSDRVGNYAMDSITISAEVSAKGTVSLLGTGGEMAGKGGMTFTFKRQTT